MCLDQFKTENEYLLQQLSRQKTAFHERLHQLHDRIDPSSSIRSVEATEDQAYLMVCQAADELKECLRLSECKIDDAENAHREEMLQLKQFSHQQERQLHELALDNQRLS